MNNGFFTRVFYGVANDYILVFNSTVHEDSYTTLLTKMNIFSEYAKL